MAGNLSLRMRQLISVAEARTKRAADAVSVAQQAVQAARFVQDQAQSALSQALAEQTKAKQEFAAQPSHEQIRLWGAHCDQIVQTRLGDVEAAMAELSDAELATAAAIKFWQRQQLRQDHIEKHAHQLAREALRTQERKSEDELQGSGKATMMLASAL